MARYTLRQLESFVAVAEAGSIVEAASELGLSSSAVGAAVNDLEHALAATLTIRRKSRGVEITAHGKFVLREARDILSRAEDLEEATRGPDTDIYGKVTIGSYVSLAPTLLAPVMAEFGAKHPHVELEFVTGTQQDLAEQVLAGRLDVLIAYDLGLPAGLNITLLGGARPTAVLPVQHRLADHDFVDLRALAQEPMILLDISPSRENTFLIFSEAGLTPNIGYRTTDFEVTRSMVAYGMGYAILVQRPAGDLAYDGTEVVVKPIVPELRSLNVVIAQNAQMRPSRATAELVRLAQLTMPARLEAIGIGPRN